MEPKRIMIVDDSATMRLVIRNCLTHDPNLVVAGSAENGRKAIEELAVVKPDLILLDIEMPEMDGIEFLRAARSKTTAKILVLSSVAPAGSARALEARRLGADGIISKPSGAISFDLKAARGSELFASMYQLLKLGVPVVA